MTVSNVYESSVLFVTKYFHEAEFHYSYMLYNHLKTLEECLESLSPMIWSPFGLLLSDDEPM